jgi:rhomboid family GlyGly-CTERM serine protease
MNYIIMKKYRLTLCVFAFLVLLHLPVLLPSLAWDRLVWLRGAMVFSREAILGGEYWRLLTGQLLFFGHYDLCLDILPLPILGYLLEPEARKRMLAIMLISALGVGLCVLLFNPELELYCGISGIVYGVIAWGLIVYYRRIEGKEYGVWLLLLSMFILKIVLECAGSGFAPMHSQNLAFPALPEAHLYGALAGLAGAIIFGVPKLVACIRRNVQYTPSR